MRSCYSKSRTSRNRFPWQIIIFGFLALIIFSAGLFHLRNGKKEIAETEQRSMTVLSVNSEIFTDYKLVDFSVEETLIKSLSSNLEVGTATRGVENKIFYHRVKVNLPAIDRETEFYEGWLVRQSPFDFFSTGEMATNELGEFVLEWAGTHDDIMSFDNVVVTREVRDGDPAPAEHVAEGKW